MPLIYSTPQRRLRGRVLPLIPNEIYLEIFDWFQAMEFNFPQGYRNLLSSMAPVCRFFRFVARPLLFASIWISGDAGVGSVKDHAILNKLIAINDKAACEVAQYIKFFRITEWNHLEFDSTSEPELPSPSVQELLLNTHYRALRNMPNLKDLTLFNVTINSRFFAALSTTKSLKTLFIFKCNFEYIKSESTIQSVSGLQLESFAWRGCSAWTRSSPCWTALNNFLITPKLRKLSTDSKGLLQSIVDSEQDLDINDLSVALDDYDLLFRLLALSPLLLTLRVTLRSPREAMGVQWKQHIPDHGLVPTLRSLNAESLDFLAQMLHGRPIQSLGVDKMTFAESVGLEDQYNVLSSGMMSLKSSTSYSSIRQLHLPWSHTRFVSSPADFPYLSSLTIDFCAEDPEAIGHPLELLDEQAVKWSPSPCIRQLIIVGSETDHFWDLKRQHEILISSISRTFPGLQSFILQQAIEWRRPYPCAKWHPAFDFPSIFFMDSETKACQHLARLSPGLVKDYNNFYSSFFRRSEYSPCPDFN